MSTPAPTSDDAIDPQQPWLGLSSFTEPTRSLFFGRDNEIQELLDRIDAQPLTVLFGLSGRGKSSLLGAGVIPRLRDAGARPVLLRLCHDGQQTLVEQLRTAWDDAVGCAPSGHTLWERAHSRADHTPLRAHPPVIILDQFEEVFTLGQAQSADLKALFQELAGLVENRVPRELRQRLADDDAFAAQFEEQTTPARVVITLREDFLAQLEAWKGQLPALMRNRMVLLPLNGPQALEAVLLPGRLGGSELVDKATGAAIVRFVAQAEGDVPLQDIEAVPPLLSLLCFELNEARLKAQAPCITLQQVTEQGSNILQNFYVRCFDGLPEPVRDVIEGNLIVSESGHRNSCTQVDLLMAMQSAGVAPGDADTAVARLVDARLLTQERSGATQRIELTHDLLAPLVVKSRNERRDRLRLAAAEAERLAAQADREAAEQRTRELESGRRKLQRMLAITAALAVVAVITLVIAWRSEGRARESLATAREAQQTAESAKNLAEQEAKRASDAETAARDMGSQAQLAAEKARHAEEDTRKALTTLQAQARALVTSQRLTAETLTLARQNIDEVLSTLDRPEMDDVHGFGPIEKDLFDKLVPLEKSLADKLGADRSPAGLVRKLRLDMRAAALQRSEGDHAGASKLWQSVHEAIAALPESRQTPALSEIHFDAISKLLQDAYLHDELDAGALVAYTRKLVARTSTLPGGRYGREAASTGIARRMRAQAQLTDAIDVLVQARSQLLEQVRLRPGDRFALEGLIVTRSLLAKTLRQADRKDEAALERQAVDQLVALGRQQFPRARSFARQRISILFDMLEEAYVGKDMTTHVTLAAEVQALINEFRGTSADMGFEAAEGWLLVLRSNFERFVKQDAARARGLGLAALKIYSDLYKGRSVALPFFDNADGAMATVTSANELLEEQATPQDRLELRARHGLELVEQSAPFLTCAIASGAGAECHGLVRTATTWAIDRLKKNQPAEVVKLARTRKQLFELAAQRMVAMETKLPAGVPMQDRPSTEPLAELCGLERDVGQALIKVDQVAAARTGLQSAADQCMTWVARFDWEYYLRSSTGGVLNALVAAEDQLGNRIQARAVAKRCWEAGMLQCRDRYLDIVRQTPGAATDTKLLAQLERATQSLKRFTVRASTKDTPKDGLAYQWSVYIEGDSPNPKYFGIEDQAIWALRNRNVVIPQDVRTSFLKLHQIARENDVPFVDLAVYALGAASSERDAPDDLLQVIRTELAAASFKRGARYASDEHGVAVAGVDVVELFERAKEVEGSARYRHLHGGAIWVFKDAKNRDRFVENPQKFIPELGGYCIGRVAAGAKEPGLARYPIHFEGRLYLACSEEVFEQALRQMTNTLTAARAQWDKLADQPGDPTTLSLLGRRLGEKPAVPKTPAEGKK